ncbi:MAG TPA: autotransporter assembly complex family protein, partial [Rhizobiaceae bacterium]|nr:autotransporter assembly complex family protein [Rhizobiaceae bacterium]
GTEVKAGKLAVEAWRQQGHPKAELASRDVTADHPANALEAILTVEPGERAAYGDITVDGAARMDPQFVAWYTKLRPGAEFDPDDIKEAEKRLARLDVFQSVRVNEGETIGPGGLLPIVIAVEERKLRRIGVGATISTTDGFGAQAFWLHRNLFGRAEKLRFDAKVAGIGDTLNPGEFDYSLGATFQKPGVFTPDTDFSLAIAADRLDLESYRETSASLGTGFTHRFTDELSGRAFLRAKHARFEDDDGITDFTTLGLLAGVNYDSRDNAADATRGLFFDLEAEPFQEFQFGNTAVRAVAEARTYLGFGEKNRFVLAGRLKLGTITGAPVEELPNDKLFYAGGGGSVRGYAFRNIGVDQPDGTVDGGRSLIEGSVEARARFTDTIGAAAFVDFGYVGAETIPDFDENLRFGAGLGLRYYTSLGPIRLDVAAPLNPRPGDPSFSFYAGIGQAF